MKRLSIEVFAALTMLAILAGCSGQQLIVGEMLARDAMFIHLMKSDNPAEKAAKYSADLDRFKAAIDAEGELTEEIFNQLLRKEFGDDPAVAILSKDFNTLIKLSGADLPDGQLPPTIKEAADVFIAGLRFSVDQYLPK